jgi:hypothetical protein
MAEKLAESTWTSYTKKQKLELEDKALLKALAGFDKAENGKPDARLAALDEVTEQIRKQVAALVKVKKQLGDKPFGAAKDKLQELLQVAEKLQQDARQASLAEKAPAAAKKPNPPGAEDEEPDSPALLTTAMVPLVRVLLKGEVGMHALIAVAPKRAAVLIMRRSISASRRKLLAEYLQMTSGLKYVAAEVTGASGLLEFALDSASAGLSKKLRQAVLDQTGLRAKVFVKFGDDTETAEADDENADGAAAGADGATAGAADSGGDRAASEGAGGTAAGAAGPARTAAGDDAAKVAHYQECRAIYAKARSQLQSNLQKLEKTVSDMCTIEAGYDPGDAAERAASVHRVLDVLDERLLHTLDRAAAEPARRDRLEQEALDIIDTYLEYATGDPLVAAIDDNGFVAVGIRRSVVDALSEVARRL